MTDQEFVDQPIIVDNAPNDVAVAAGADPAMVSDAVMRAQLNHRYTEQRMKTWDERTPDERIEVLREALRSKDMAIQDLRQQIDLLMQHRHAKDGQVVAPLYGRGAMCAPGGYYDPLA